MLSYTYLLFFFYILYSYCYMFKHLSWSVHSINIWLKQINVNNCIAHKTVHVFCTLISHHHWPSKIILLFNSEFKCVCLKVAKYYVSRDCYFFSYWNFMCKLSHVYNIIIVQNLYSIFLLTYLIWNQENVFTFILRFFVNMEFFKDFFGKFRLICNVPIVVSYLQISPC